MTYVPSPWERSQPSQPTATPQQQQFTTAEEQREYAINEIKHGRGHKLPGRSFSRYMARVWIYAAGSACVLLAFPAMSIVFAIASKDGKRLDAWWITVMCSIAALEIAAAVVASFARRNPLVYSAIGTGVAASALFFFAATSVMSATRSGFYLESMSRTTVFLNVIFSIGLVGRISSPFRVPGFAANW